MFPNMTDYQRRILVTGGAGFIGSNVLRLLVRKFPQYFFINLDKLDACSNPSHLQPIAHLPNYKFVKGSILSPDLISYLLRNEHVDSILHFAAQTHVDNSFGNPLEFTQNNVMGTHVLLEEARAYGKDLKLFIHVSTDEVYGPSDETCRETSTVLNPTNPYAATKMAAEALVKSYAASFSLPVIITRGNNVYGPGQYPEKLIPKFICRLLKQLPCCIHGSGNHTRNFLYVEDVAEAFDMIFHRGEVGSVYNIGNSFSRSNLEVAKDIIKIMGLAKKRANPDNETNGLTTTIPSTKKRKINGAEETNSQKQGENEQEEEEDASMYSVLIEYVEDRKYNDHRYNIDTTRLQKLGWVPKTSWTEGLTKTIDWYQKNIDIWARLDEALKPHPTFKTNSTDILS